MRNHDPRFLLDQAFWCLVKSQETEDPDLKAELAFLGRSLVRNAHRQVLASEMQ